MERGKLSFVIGFWLGICLFQPVAVARFVEPPPGSIYRDYWTTMSTSGNAWRVTDPNATHSGARAFLPNPVLTIAIADLQGAVRAEAILDIWGGHPGTSNKRLRFNANPWIPIPELTTTPTAGECYVQQWNVTVDVPIAHLVQGNNRLEGTSGGQTCFDFGWGQWGWYGIIVRIYYDISKPHPTGQIVSHASGGTFGDNPTLAAIAQSSAGVNRVDFIAAYEDYDRDGDGYYTDWQRNYHRGRYDTEVRARNIVGSVTAAPWQVVWNTEWLPNQPSGSVKLIARIRDNNGIWFVTNAVENLTFNRSQGTVKLYKPVGVHEVFWVRAGETKSCTIPIPDSDSLHNATAAKLYIATWNGIDGQGSGHWKRINGWTVPVMGEDHYYALNDIPVPVSALQPGNNVFSFYSGSTHHGVEIMWPGPAVAVKYSRVTSVPEALIPSGFSLSQNYPNPFNPSTTIRYSLPEQARVVIEVYDILGRLVTTLTKELVNAGYFEVVWNGTDASSVTVGSGTYIYVMNASTPSGKSVRLTRRMSFFK